MPEKPLELTKIHTHPIHSNVPKEKMIAAKKHIAEIDKTVRKNTKGETCLICGKACSSFCRSHSIPDFVLRNIDEDGYVSAPRQADSLEPNKSTGVLAAGVFFNICEDCDSKFFQRYEEESAFDGSPSDEMLTAMAVKNCLKTIYQRTVDREENAIYSERIESPKLISNGEVSAPEQDIKEFQMELQYALQPKNTSQNEKYHLCYYKKLDYVVPFATQFAMAMLVDLEGNTIHDLYSGSSSYRMEHLHVAVFPFKQSSVVLLFTKNGETKHRRFIRQLKKLEEQDQLSAINFLVFSGADNVFVQKSCYERMSKNPIFMEACRLTYALDTNVEKPKLGLHVAQRAHNFKKRYALPNLLSPQYALKTEEVLTE